MISLSKTKFKMKRSSPRRESPFPPTRFATAFANLLLAVSSGWALRSTGNPTPWPSGPGHLSAQHLPLSTVTFSLYLLHSVLGVVRYGNPQYGNSLSSLYENTAFLCIVIALPCFAAQLARMYSASFYYVLPLMALPLLVTVWHYMKRLFSNATYNGGEARWAKSKRVSAVVILSLGFILVLSYKNLNYYGFAAALAYAHNYFLVGPTGTAFNLPAVDLFLYQLAFFNYFAVKALHD